MDKGWQHAYEAGKRAFEEEKYDSALYYLERVAKEKGTFADVFNMLGLIYHYKGFQSEAVSAFLRAVDINPNYTEAHLNLSVVYNEKGDFGRAEESYRKARDSRRDAGTYLDPFVKGKLANMHASIGTIYKDLGFYPEAAEEFRKALSLRPEFIDIKTKLGIVYRDMKDFHNSLRELTEAVHLNEDYTNPRVQLGLTYYTMGDNERAKAEWLKALEKNPDDKMANMYLTLLLTPSR